MSWSITDNGRVRDVKDRLPRKVEQEKAHLDSDTERSHVDMLAQTADALLEKAQPGSIATLSLNGHAGSENSFTGYLQLSVSASAPMPSS